MSDSGEHIYTFQVPTVTGGLKLTNTTSFIFCPFVFCIVFTDYQYIRASLPRRRPIRQGSVSMTTRLLSRPADPLPFPRGQRGREALSSKSPDHPKSQVPAPGSAALEPARWSSVPSPQRRRTNAMKAPAATSYMLHRWFSAVGSRATKKN